MPAKVFNNHTELIESLTDGKHKLNLSSIKYNTKDQSKQYPFVWVSLTDTENHAFHSGLSIVFATDASRLPIVFVAEQSGSTLCRVNESNVPIISAMKAIEQTVRQALPAHQQHMLAPILRESTHPNYPNSRAISVKTKFTAIDHSKCEVSHVAVRHTMTKYILQLQKLSLHDNMFKCMWSVQAIGGMEHSNLQDMGRDDAGGSSCGEDAMIMMQSDDQLFSMMQNTY